MSPMEARAAALQAAVAIAATTGRPVRTVDVVTQAERLERWIIEGVLPKLPAGMME